jgi:hypothetical protein
MINKPTKNAGAAVTAPDVQKTYEAAQLPANNSAILAARHPILSTHWGFSV